MTINVPAFRQRIEDMNLLVERFALEFTRSNDIPYRGFMPEAIRSLKQYNWPGNVRELKHFVERILVLEKGERITAEMVEKQLNISQPLGNTNPHLPILVDQSPERAERELILRQLFLLRQDMESVKHLLDERPTSYQEPISYIQSGNPIEQDPMEIDENSQHFIRSDAVGDMTLEDLEEEAICRTLKYFNNNRRAAAKSLGMSERTLYRKINEYGLERKIKKS